MIECLPGVELAAICDTNANRAAKAAERYGVEHSFTSIEAAIGSGTFNCAHVLVPPEWHVPVATQLIDAGIDVLIEKPMAISRTDCEAVSRAAAARGVRVGVNHNATFYAAYLKLRRAVRSGSFGPLQHMIVVVNRPSHQLARRGHWTFRHPRNVIYEVAAHPLSQIFDLGGSISNVQSTVSGRHDLGAGLHFFDTWQVSLVCARATAQLFLSYAPYQMYQMIAICEDGVLTAEVEQNRFTALDRARWGHYYNQVHPAASAAVQAVSSGLQNLAREADAVLHPSPPQDPYFTSMRGSITSFYSGSSEHQPTLDGDFGTQVVSACEAVTQVVAPDVPEAPRRIHPGRPGGCEVAMLGGTDFVGAALLERLLAIGLRVAVVARDASGLRGPFVHPEVQLLEGDIADQATVSAAIRGAHTVIQLARPVRASWQDVESSIVTTTRELARSCIRQGAQRIIYVGSISSLYLGEARATITGSTPIDPRVSERGPGAWETARVEQVLTRFACEESFPVTVLRPGIVLGQGSTPFHPAFGIWRGEIHCIGWNAGTNPLPLVLASDVASAVISALDSEAAEGRAFNLVGDVRLSARECLTELRAALGRPLTFHARHPLQHQSLEAYKWFTRRLVRRARTPFPSYRMIRSMGHRAKFNCEDAKRALRWTPVAERAALVELGLSVYRNRSLL